MDGNMTSLWLDCGDGMTWFEDQTSTLAEGDTEDEDG